MYGCLLILNVNGGFPPALVLLLLSLENCLYQVIETLQEAGAILLVVGRYAHDRGRTKLTH